MEAPSDFSELLGLLNDHKVDYLIVGAYALAMHGAPRYTGDLDILVKPTVENAKRVIETLTEFGFGSLKLTVEDFQDPDQVVQLGFPPVRIDIITSITGVAIEEAFAGKKAGMIGGLPIYYLGRDQFVANKRAVGRLRDLADIEAIGGEVDEREEQHFDRTV